MAKSYRFETNLGFPLIFEIEGGPFGNRRLRILPSAVGNHKLEITFPNSYLCLIASCKVGVDGSPPSKARVYYGHLSSPKNCGKIVCSTGETIFVRKHWNAFTTVVESSYEYRLTLGGRDNVIGTITINRENGGKITIFKQSEQVSPDELVIGFAIALKSWLAYQNSL